MRTSDIQHTSWLYFYDICIITSQSEQGLIAQVIFFFFLKKRELILRISHQEGLVADLF